MVKPARSETVKKIIRFLLRHRMPTFFTLFLGLAITVTLAVILGILLFNRVIRPGMGMVCTHTHTPAANSNSNSNAPSNSIPTNEPNMNGNPDHANGSNNHSTHQPPTTSLPYGYYGDSKDDFNRVATLKDELSRRFKVSIHHLSTKVIEDAELFLKILAIIRQHPQDERSLEDYKTHINTKFLPEHEDTVEISFNANDTQKIYVEVGNRCYLMWWSQSNTLSSLTDERVAKVRIPFIAERCFTFSGKNLQANANGIWNVDESGVAIKSSISALSDTAISHILRDGIKGFKYLAENKLSITTPFSNIVGIRDSNGREIVGAKLYGMGTHINPECEPSDNISIEACFNGFLTLLFGNNYVDDEVDQTSDGYLSFVKNDLA